MIAAVVVNATKNMTSLAAFRIPIGIQFCWGAIIVFGMTILPESPRYYAMKDDETRARKSLSRLLGADAQSPEVSIEYHEIYDNVLIDRTMGGSYLDCFRQGGDSHNRARILTGCALQALQQLSGINFIIYFGTTYFANTGISNSFIMYVKESLLIYGLTIY